MNCTWVYQLDVLGLGMDLTKYMFVFLMKYFCNSGILRNYGINRHTFAFCRGNIYLVVWDDFKTIHFASFTKLTPTIMFAYFPLSLLRNLLSHKPS
jgi:hypothetical protein